ncbi:nucleotidyltransferase family protein [Streptomyces sp. NPDC006641]|nr:nucleotidyltransferase family protein [Streptomyces sp. JV184]MEE1749935.1 nucleotidyltransferase family protein [Streptomyces sp. JV184]
MVQPGGLGDLLAWAAGRGPRSEVPLCTQESPQAVREALVAHRLTVRFAERMAATAANRAHSEVLASVESLNRVIAERAEQHIAHVVLLQSLGAVDAPPLLIKGFTPHVNTRGRVPHHRSSDIDLLPQDPQEFIARAQEHGYHPFTRYTGFHEVGYLVLGDPEDRDGRVLLDIHRGFPVFSYGAEGQPAQAGADSFDLDPRGDAPSAIAALIDYEDLSGQWRWIELPQGRVAVLRPEVAAIIACAHLYKNCSNRAWRYRLANLPLGELADTVDMIREEDFDTDEFRRLADTYQAREAVTFVAHAAHRLLDLRFPGLEWAMSLPLRNTRVLWADYAHPTAIDWPTPLEDFDNLVIRHLGIDSYVSRLGAVELHAGADPDTARSFALGAGGSGEFTHRRELYPVRASVSVCWTDDAVIFRITPAEPEDGSVETRFLFNFGVPVYEVGLKPGGEVSTMDCTLGRETVDGPRCETLRSTPSGAMTLVAAFSARSLGDAVADGPPAACHVILGVRRPVPGTAANASTLVPLRILRE